MIQVSEARRQQLRAVVQYSGEAAAGSGVMTWAQLLELGSDQPGAALQGRLEQQAVNMACMLVYTSGTTGQAVNSSAANRLIGEVVQSRRRPLLGPSPG